LRIENLNGKLFVLLVSTAPLVEMLSGCVKGEIEANNAPVADFEWSPKTDTVTKEVTVTT